MDKVRVLQHIRILAEQADEIQFDKDNFGWVSFRMNLPKGFDQPSTLILIEIPSNFDNSPPHWFHVSQGLSIRGEPFKKYLGHHIHGESSKYAGKNWDEICFEVDSWAPAARVEAGDNILTYVMGIYSLFSTIASGGEVD